MSKVKNTLESAFQRRILSFLKTLPNTYAFKAQAGSVGGIPDIICGINCYFVALEVKKSAKQKPSPLQKITLEKIIAANNFAFVVNPENWESVKGVLVQLSEGVVNVLPRRKEKNV